MLKAKPQLEVELDNKNFQNLLKEDQFLKSVEKNERCIHTDLS